MGQIGTWFPMVRTVNTSAWEQRRTETGEEQSTIAVVPMAAMFGEPMNGA